MRRIQRFIHVARITAPADLRVSSLGVPNIEMELPGANEIDMPPGALALYVTISADILNGKVAREGAGILRSCIKREYSLMILDMKLVRTADSLGLRWLAQLKQTADWYNVVLQTRLSPSLTLLVSAAGFALPRFTPSKLKGAEA